MGIKERLIKAVPFFDVIAPLGSALWLLVGVVAYFLTQGATPAPGTIVALAVAEAVALAIRQPSSLGSWLADTVNFHDKKPNNDPLANLFRGAQLAILLLSFAMLTVAFLKVVLQQAALAWSVVKEALAAAAQVAFLNNAANIVVSIAQFAPVVGAVAAALGMCFYFYQAYSAHQQVKRYQIELDNLDAAPEYEGCAEYYPKLAASSTVGPAPANFAQYVENRQAIEQAKFEKQQAFRSGLFWGSMAVLALGAAAAMAVASLTPVGAVAIGSIGTAAVTVAVVVKAASVAVGLISAVAALSFYVNKSRREKKFAEEQEKTRSLVADFSEKAESTQHSSSSQTIQKQLTESPNLKTAGNTVETAPSTQADVSNAQHVIPQTSPASALQKNSVFNKTSKSQEKLPTKEPKSNTPVTPVPEEDNTNKPQQ